MHSVRHIWSHSSSKSGGLELKCSSELGVILEHRQREGVWDIRGEDIGTPLKPCVHSIHSLQRIPATHEAQTPRRQYNGRIPQHQPVYLRPPPPRTITCTSALPPPRNIPAVDAPLLLLSSCQGLHKILPHNDDVCPSSLPGRDSDILHGTMRYYWLRCFRVVNRS
jgi:hypothetical protein